MKARLSALAAVAALASGSASAQQAGSWQAGAGWLHFAPQDSSTPLTFTAPVPAVVPGSGATVGTSDTLGLNLTYFVDSHWAVEGVMGIPPKFKLDGTGTLAPIGELGNARQWSPTLLAKYYFNDGAAPFRPFVGLGVTYVWYSDVTLTPGLQNALGRRLGQAPGATTTSAKLDNSFSAVFNLGVAYQFDKHWGMAFSVSYIPLKTKAKLTTTTAFGLPVATSESSLKVNPIVPYLSVTYTF
ncbi:MAG: OmpW family protein [Variovorax sp.]|nr:MAG: OmpW family protein [Variovorax sp.]